MKFTVVFNKRHEVVVKSASNSYEKHEIIYNTLTSHDVDVNIAMDCASFCELAAAGETYNEADFDVYIEEY